MEKEIWKDIPDFNGDYQISNYGNVKSLKNNKEIILKPGINNPGYKFVNLCKFNKTKNIMVHRLVALNFKENPNNLKIVNHIDSNKFNNHVDNLEFVSQRDNVSHGFSKKQKSSKYNGIFFCNTVKKWRARIRMNGKIKNIGDFKNEEDAYNARKCFEIENNIINKYT